MFLFTSNVTGVEVPYKNIVEAYQYVKTKHPGQAYPSEILSWRDILS